MIKKIALIGVFSLGAAFQASAQDSSRINQLEQEIQSIKLRLLKLESPQGTPTDTQKSTTNDGWRSLSNWRQLTTGMTPDDVRRVLGEPARVNGGAVATWYYQNRGYVTFMSDKLYSWGEPK